MRRGEVQLVEPWITVFHLLMYSFTLQQYLKRFSFYLGVCRFFLKGDLTIYLFEIEEKGRMKGSH